MFINKADIVQRVMSATSKRINKKGTVLIVKVKTNNIL